MNKNESFDYENNYFKNGVCYIHGGYYKAWMINYIDAYCNLCNDQFIFTQWHIKISVSYKIPKKLTNWLSCLGKHWTLERA